MMGWEPIETYPALKKPHPPVVLGCHKHDNAIFVCTWIDGKFYIVPGMPIYYGFPDRKMGYMTCSPDYWMDLPPHPEKKEEENERG